jgi:hypothetical protein
MADNQLQQQEFSPLELKRNIEIFTTGGKNKVIQTAALSWAELIPEIQADYPTLAKMNAIIGETNTQIVNGDSQLPDGDFTLFFVPQATKSGNAKKSAVKAPAKKAPAAKKAAAPAKKAAAKKSAPKKDAVNEEVKEGVGGILGSVAKAAAEETIIESKKKPTDFTDAERVELILALSKDLKDPRIAQFNLGQLRFQAAAVARQLGVNPTIEKATWQQDMLRKLR